MRDPRTNRFYKLDKRDPHQLSDAELRELITYCEQMIDYCTHSKSRKQWISKTRELADLLPDE